MIFARVLPVLALAFSLSTAADTERRNCGKETLDAKNFCKQEADGAFNGGTAAAKALGASVADQKILHATGGIENSGIADNLGRYSGAATKCKKAKETAEDACAKAMAEAQKRHKVAESQNDFPSVAQEEVVAKEINTNWIDARDSIKSDLQRLNIGAAPLKAATIGATEVSGFSGGQTP